jgi:TPR repeat protein
MSMANGDQLPAPVTGRGLVPADQSESMLTRGLQAIKNRQQALVFGVETDAKKSFLEGVAAEKCGDYAAAENCYRKAADQGYAEAQLNLGVMYEEGRAPDEVEGHHYDQGAWYLCQTEHWLRLAAEQGYAKARSKLGVLLYEHMDFFGARELVEATKWFRLAAEVPSRMLVGISGRDLRQVEGS